MKIRANVDHSLKMDSKRTLKLCELFLTAQNLLFGFYFELSPKEKFGVLRQSRNNVKQEIRKSKNRKVLNEQS